MAVSSLDAIVSSEEWDYFGWSGRELEQANLIS